MKISKKCQYALKAVFELAWREQDEPVKTQEIADAQHISLRFIEIILNELKRGGFVVSKRGKEGGYKLAKDARRLTVLEIIEYIEGPVSLVQNDDTDAASTQNEALKEFWQEVNNAIADVCDKKTFADLVEYEQSKRSKYALNYNI